MSSFKSFEKLRSLSADANGLCDGPILEKCLGKIPFPFYIAQNFVVIDFELDS